MVRRAAGDDVDAVDEVELLGREVELVDLQRAGGQAPGQGVADDARLLVDLLEHEVGVAALLGHVQVPVHVGDGGIEGPAGLVEEGDGVRREARHLAVGEHHHVARGVDHGDDVAGDVAAALAAAHHDGRVLAGDDDDAGLVGAHDGQAVGADEAARGVGDGRLEVAHVGVGLLHQVGDHLGVGVALEGVAARGELLAQLGEVLDDAVVHHGDVAGARGMGMRVGLGGPAVGGPARVADAAGAREVEVGQRVGEPRHLPLAADHLERAVLLDGDARRVVAAVLQPRQPLDEDALGRVGPRVAHDSAHKRSCQVTCVAGRPRARRRGAGIPPTIVGHRAGGDVSPR